MALFKVFKGASGALDTQPLVDGYCWFTYDDGKLYIDYKDPTDSLIKRTALSAEKADKDNLGSILQEAYAASLSLSGHTLKLLAKDGTTVLTSLTLPINATSYLLSGSLDNDNGFVTTLTASNGIETTATIPGLTGATNETDGTAGLAPAPEAGDQSKYLRGDGTWATPTNTDTLVTQNNTTSNTNYRVLLSFSAENGSETKPVYKNSNLSYNPSQNKLTSGNLSLTNKLEVDGESTFKDNVTIKDQITLGTAGTHTISADGGNYSGNSGSATKLQTPRKLKVNLGSTSDVTFDGSSDQVSIPVAGTLPVARGGTGVTSIADIKAGKDASGNTITLTYAPLASPQLTGIPTAPTAADSTNTNQLATTAFVMNAFKANDAMIFQGIVNSASDLPTTHNKGWTYKVGTAGVYLTGTYCEVGDLIICVTDGTSADDSHWGIIQNNIDGAVFMGHGGTSVGSASQPVYVAANGQVTAITGTIDNNAKSADKVNQSLTLKLNNSDTVYNGSTAKSVTFYAPTGGGTANTQALVGNGATSAPKWVNIAPGISITAGTDTATPKINVSVLGQSGTAQSLTTASTSVYGATKLTSSYTSTNDTLAATGKSILAAIQTLDVGAVGVAAATGNRYISQISEADGKISATLATATIGSTYIPIWIDGGTIKPITTNSVLTNLGSTTAASTYAAAPRPGVTGTLPIVNGGTGQTTAAGIFNVVRDNGGDAHWVKKVGDTMTGDLLFANSGTGIRQVRFMSGDNDYGRIAAGATTSNAGWLEIATADDGNEPIYIRQYTGVFSSITRTLTLLDASGNTTLPGTLNLAGNRYAGPDGAHGLNANNSDIVGVNGIFTSDLADSFSEGLNFRRSTGNPWDSFAASNGTFYFGANKAFDAGLVGDATIAIGKLVNTAVSQQAYYINGANDQAEWITLGTLVSAGDNSSVTIDIYTGSGYNGQPNQNTHIAIFIKDGWQSTQAAATSFGLDYLIYDSTTNANLIQVQGRASQHNTLIVYVYLPWGYWNGYYTIQGRYTTWTHSGAHSTAAPTENTAQEVALGSITAKTFNGNSATTTAIKDMTNNTLTYSNYGAAGLAGSAISQFTCWNGYELRAISKAETFNAIRDNGGDSRWVKKAGDTMTGALNFANGTTYYINNSADANLRRGLFAGTTNADTASSNWYNTGALEIRENGRVGNAQSALAFAPTIGFHWANRIAATLKFHSDGIFYFRKQNGTDRASIDANLVGNANTATALQTARSLWGNSFNGTSDIIGNIVFPATDTTGTANGVSWSGSTDNAKIDYTVPSSDLGILRLNVGDDANARISLRNRDTEYFRIDGVTGATIQGATTGSNAYNSANPRLTFMNAAGDQNCQLIWTDYDSVVPTASLTLVGNQGGEHFIAPKINAGGYINNTYAFSAASAIINSWIRTTGSTGWYNESYDGGWYMTDSTWIRSYGSKNIYQNTGILRTDGQFQVGDNGNKFYANSAGNGYFSNTLGIGGINTGYKLYVNGTSYLNGNTTVINYLNNIKFRAVTINNSTSFSSSGTQELFGTTDNTNAKFSILRMQGSAPASLRDNYASGISWKMSDTYGLFSVAYGTPAIKIAGGNGTNPVWWIGLNGTSGQTYTFPTSSKTLAASDGTNASGTWGISISGNASTATTLQTPRTINGTSFNGSANITTANWGTERNIYIADNSSAHTGPAVSVNGSGNVTLKLPATIQAGISYPLIKNTIDVSSQNVDTWYPVTIPLPRRGFNRLKLAVELNSGTKPAWSTHDNGFTAIVDMLITASGWGTTGAFSICLENDQRYITDSAKPPVGYSQLGNSSHAVLWLRGGGKYFLYTDFTPTITIRTASTTITSQTVAPTTTYPGISYAKATIGANLDGSASTATTLQTARTINGTSFNGSANITTANWGTARNIYIADNSSANTGPAVSVNGSGNVTLKLPATITATLSGNASTATKLQTARTIRTNLASTTAVNFDGSANITPGVTGTLPVANGGTGKFQYASSSYSAEYRGIALVSSLPAASSMIQGVIYLVYTTEV